MLHTSLHPQNITKKDHQTYLEYVIFNAKHWIQTNTVITQTSDLKYLCFDPVWCLKSN